MSDTTVEAPQQTPQEAALIAQQTALLQQQQQIYADAYSQYQMLQPVLMEQAGIIPTYGEGGKITGYELAPEKPEDAALRELTLSTLTGSNQLVQQQLADLQANAPLRADVEQATLERTLAALEGTLPVDPTLMDELDKAERELEERFASQLGPGYQTSSPYIEAKNDFVRTKEATLEAARRGEITTLGTLGFNMGSNTAGIAQGASTSGLPAYAANQNAMQQLLGNVTSLSQQPLTYGSAYGNVVQGLNSPLQSYQFDRNLQYQASAAEAQANAQMWGGLFSGAGSIAGAGLVPGGFLR
jgi:hypothetical protein